MPPNSTIALHESASDAALLVAFTNSGDSLAFTSLVQRYHGLVHGAARRILGNDQSACDIAQEVFVRFSQEAHRIRPAALGAWLHRASVRRALNELRASRRRLNRESAAMNTRQSDHLPDPLPEHWESALEHLDDAMDRLNDTERQCIIERFHQDHSLRDIASHTGKSEDAARMAIQRALEKMCGFLRRRGVVVSSAALASGLSTELSRASISLTNEAAAALSVHALSAGKIAGSTSTALILTTTLMTKPAFLITAALLAFALATGAGYLANKADKGLPHGAVAEDSASRGDQPPGAALPSHEKSAASVPAKAPLTVAEQAVARIEGIWKRKEALVRRAPQRDNPPPDPKEVAQLYADMEALMLELRSVTSVLDGTTLPDAIVIALSREGEIRGFVLSALFEHWAGIDAEAARAAAAKQSKDVAGILTAAIARGWGMTDPPSALAAADKWHPGDRQARGQFIRRVFEGWNRTNAAGAVQAFASLPVDDQLQVEREFDKLVRQPAQLAAAAPEIAKLGDEVLRGKLVKAVAEKWAQYDGPAASAWFDAISWSDPRAGLEAAMELADEWIGSGGNPSDAADWAWRKVPDELRGKFVKSLIQRKWAAQDRAAAEAWLSRHNLTPDNISR